MSISRIAPLLLLGGTCSGDAEGFEPFPQVPVAEVSGVRVNPVLKGGLKTSMERGQPYFGCHECTAVDLLDDALRQEIACLKAHAGSELSLHPTFNMVYLTCKDGDSDWNMSVIGGDHLSVGGVLVQADSEVNVSVNSHFDTTLAPASHLAMFGEESGDYTQLSTIGDDDDMVIHFPGVAEGAEALDVDSETHLDVSNCKRGDDLLAAQQELKGLAKAAYDRAVVWEIPEWDEALYGPIPGPDVELP